MGFGIAVDAKCRYHESLNMIEEWGSTMTPKYACPWFALAACALLAGCGESSAPEPPPPAQQPAAEPDPGPAEHADDPDAAIDAFMARIAEHCGEAFEGSITVNEPEADDDPFVGQRLVMHVRECLDDELRIPFHVGDDHSRTWLLTRTEDGLLLKHDHRKEDGSDDELTMYGGETTEPGTATRQAFPIDDETVELFERLELERSLGNVWAMEIEPGRYFAYELTRHDGSIFRVDFDLTETVDTPPTPWGWPELED